MVLPYSLKGIENKTRFVAEHELFCFQHSVCLPGEIHKCCCKDSLTAEFFAFRFNPIGNPKDKKTFYAGSGCGRDLIELASLHIPPILDLFGLLLKPSGSAQNASGKNSIEQNSDPLHREFVLALAMLFAIWGHSDGFLGKLYAELLAHPQKRVYPSNVSTLNKAVRGTIQNLNLQNTTLRKMFAQKGESKGLKARTCNFPMLDKILKDNGEESLL